MSKPMAYPEIKKLIRRAMESDQNFLMITEENKENPQVADVRRKVQGRLEAWSAVLDATQGNPAMLRLHAEHY
jgi:hypothetical protein